jgi:hypothetical protein
MAVSRFVLFASIVAIAACDFGINTTGLAGEGGVLPDTGSDVVSPADAGDETIVADSGPDVPVGPAHLFGDTNVESTQDSIAMSTPDGFRHQAVAGGNAQTVWIYVDSQTSGATFDVGIYDDDNTTTPEQPKGLLAFASFSSVTSGWNSQTLSTPITITQDSYYWIVVNVTNSTLYYRNAGSTSGSLESVSATSTALPTSWSPVDHAFDGPASMYVAP